MTCMTQKPFALSLTTMMQIFKRLIVKIQYTRTAPFHSPTRNKNTVHASVMELLMGHYGVPQLKTMTRTGNGNYVNNGEQKYHQVVKNAPFLSHMTTEITRPVQQLGPTGFGAL